MEGYLPQKKHYRQRAHTNPISDHSFIYPAHPSLFDWSSLYPGGVKTSVEYADIGCGYGGLLLTLAEMYPDKYALGMEIRVKVSDYVSDRISALRTKHPGKYERIACIRTNAMKYLPNFFRKSQLKKMFFLYPDPHFKRSKHKWRIINRCLLDEYAYVLAPGGRIYTATDIKDLYEWTLKHFDEHPLFRQLSKEEQMNDELVDKLSDSTEEGKKVKRNNGSCFIAVFERTGDT